MKQQNIRNFVLGCIFIAAAVMAGCGGEKVIVTPAPAATPLVQTVPASPALGVVATVPPLPPSPSEVVSVSPGTDYIWVKGYYNWDGSRYQWMPGTWGKGFQPRRGLGTCALAALEWRLRLGCGGLAVASDRRASRGDRGPGRL
jgi:WXXGXW repeat (2 copies)